MRRLRTDAKGIATNFKEAIGQATQIIEKRREQEEARRREQEREERLAKQKNAANRNGA